MPARRAVTITESGESGLADAFGLDTGRLDDVR
jgi:hypothetical protein